VEFSMKLHLYPSSTDISSRQFYDGGLEITGLDSALKKQGVRVQTGFIWA
jgi:hypothetical protein